MKLATSVLSLYFILTTTDSLHSSCPFQLPRCPLPLSGGRSSFALSFACSGRDELSAVAILSVNGPHTTWHGEAICPHRDGCILRFLQLHFWQTDIWAQFKTGGITCSRVCNADVRASCKPWSCQTWRTHCQRLSFCLSCNIYEQYMFMLLL